VKSDLVQDIEKKTQFIKIWRTELSLFKELAEKGIYIRVGSSGYRPISIVPENPCGRLFLRENRDAINREVIDYSSELPIAIKNAKDADEPKSYVPGKDQKELRMQATLIRHALKNNLSLHELCDGFADVFDELIFVTDEIPAGNIRADIIALGGMKGCYFPVFIELKAKRLLTTLTKQLTNAKDTMEVARDSFLNLLANATGKPKSDIAFDDAKLLMIWPKPKRKGRSVVAKARENGFIVAEYEYDESTPRIIRTT